MALIIFCLTALSFVLLNAFAQALLLVNLKELHKLSRQSPALAFFQNHFFTPDTYETTLSHLHLTQKMVFFALFFFLGAGLKPFILCFFLLFLADYLFYLLASLFPRFILKNFSSVALLWLYLLYPLAAPLIALYQQLVLSKKNSIAKERRLCNLLLNDYDEKLFSSLATFNEKDAREVMIPRIKMFALSSATTIKKAAKMVLSEKYSRVPVYGNDLDSIVGVLMYKDLLKVYTEAEKASNLLDEKIEMLVKPVIYAPENKKISALFQELRKKQRHLAIIVNEYGETEGIITIEDILEELVGEIKDEYDVGEEEPFWHLPNGSWIVDAKASIIDIEKKVGIPIPHSPEYETVGGFLFHKAGAIPPKGWKLYLDEFEIEVLISSERCLEKLRIIPLLEKKEKIAKE
ncbi:MAG: hemolysin family protein [Parachlamydiales bacterium]|jgi:CBS domain containing-hemolysin-like protein